MTVFVRRSWFTWALLLGALVLCACEGDSSPGTVDAVDGPDTVAGPIDVVGLPDALPNDVVPPSPDVRDDAGTLPADIEDVATPPDQEEPTDTELPDVEEDVPESIDVPLDPDVVSPQDIVDAPEDAGGALADIPDVGQPEDVAAPVDITWGDCERSGVNFCGCHPSEPGCNDGNPCTVVDCHDDGRCFLLTVSGDSCNMGGECGRGTCRFGRCVDLAGCDDGFICTEDLCEDGSCVHELADPQYRPAPGWTMEDTNPYSATFGEQLSLQDWYGKVVILTFHASTCEPCWEQSEFMRIIYDAVRGYDDVLFATVDTRGAMHNVETYVTSDADGAPPLVSEWPMLVDNQDYLVWNHYCGETHSVVIIDTTGVVVHHRHGNYVDGPFREMLLDRIEALRPR